MIIEFEEYGIDTIHEKYAWRICNLMVANSERFKRFFPETLKQNLTPNLSKYFVEKKLKLLRGREEFLFVLKEKENRAVIGLIYIKEIDWKKEEAELAYCIGYQYQRKGRMTESIKAISKYAFENLGLKTLRIIVHESNIASVRVADKCGYIWQVTLENEFTPPNEDPVNMELYVLYK